ncbi:hypothetical protein VP1G_02919 [Cytospora mali]|uniref:HAUS augmin-like complex subunit 3 N-terminal domain-containing protein n=1 Tax=Cytospora mali TaxID=578113 RepID=A0A194UVC0_CYTMA|nr:hypothetical protein VP1G_02919 [Valsa mali var. pyri (nom. inval.)]
MAYDELVKILRKYDIALDPHALASVFDDDEQGILLAEWAKSHLTADTLLTKDELNSYAPLIENTVRPSLTDTKPRYLVIERNGKADELAASENLSTTQALTDQELKDAIDELNRSTEAINKQTGTLRQQQDALSRLLTNTGKSGDARSDLETKRLYKWDTDRKALNTAVELLSQSIDYHISELEQQTKGPGGDVGKLLDEIFRSDNKLLTSLQKLGWELDAEDPEETESVGKLREICARLIKYTVECIRTKLDRLYLETLESYVEQSAGSHAAKDEVHALQDELESLYSEILPVAQMSVEQQWLEPSLRTLSAKNGHTLGRSAEALKYMLDCLDYLLDRTSRTYDCVSTFKAHTNAGNALMATAKAELSVAIAPPAKRRGTVNSLSSPVRRRPLSMTDATMTPAPRGGTSTTQSRRRSSGGALYDSPLHHLLDELAINISGDDDSTSSMTAGTTREQAFYISSILAERNRKASEVRHNVQSAFEGTAISYLTDARTALQLVRDSVLAESPYTEVHLVDPGIEASIGVLAQEVHTVTSRLEGVERETAVLARGRNLKKEEIISRWGGRG